MSVLISRLGAIWATGIGLLLAAGPLQAEPMQLDDATPRWVVVQFEDSPNEHPEWLDRVYTRPFAAWLETDARGRIVVRVDGAVLEKSLFSERDPVAGSFSDYVWIFDPETGAVESASFSGVFAYEVGWGFATTEVHARVRADMRTTRDGGFRGPEPVWGQRLLVWCGEDVSPSDADTACTRVPSVGYDDARGYVNATGFLAIDSPIAQFVTYSAVGEARFSELPADVRVTPPVATGPEVNVRVELSPSASGRELEAALQAVLAP